jgi:Leucine-rich repeat (LRR) protein
MVFFINYFIFFRLISEIDIVPLKFRKIEVLFLSHNCIDNLENIKQFQNLKTLSVAFNKVFVMFLI